MKGLFAAVATPVHDDVLFDEAGSDGLGQFLVEGLASMGFGSVGRV